MFSFFKKKLSEVLQSGREDVHTPPEQASDAGMPVDEAFCSLDDPAGLIQEDSAIGGAGAPALQESAVSTP